MTEAVLFDIDGTLTDSLEAFETSLRETLEESGLSDRYRPGLFGKSARQALADLGIDNEKLIDTWEKKFNRELESSSLYPGVEELFRQLWKSGIQVFIFTSRNRSNTRLFIETNGLSDYVTGFLSASDVRNAKPDPEGILRIMKQYDLDPGRVFYLGDSLADSQAAKAAGIQFFSAGWNPDAYTAQENNTFSNTEELLKYVRNSKSD